MIGAGWVATAMDTQTSRSPTTVAAARRQLARETSDGSVMLWAQRDRWSEGYVPGRFVVASQNLFV